VTYLLVVRPKWDWKVLLGPLLLLSVPTAAYGWSFDQVVLLVPYLQVVAWLMEGRAGSPAWRGLLWAALLGIAAASLAQDWLRHSDEYYVWVPWALGVVYLGGRAPARDPILPGGPS
jgi:hypothetical protein